jgi:formylglycine-generating enzyme required for sulfatase activity
MGSNPSAFKGANLPVEQVSWNDAQEFIKKLNERNDVYTYRLPTEAEWEYACRAGTTTEFAFGDSLSSEQANYDGRYPYGHSPKGKFLGRTVVAGSYQPNAWGLYDMHGNVEEWCQDWYTQDYYSQSPSADPTGPTMGSPLFSRIVRGGSWENFARQSRSAYRNWFAPDHRSYQVGFRLVRTLR